MDKMGIGMDNQDMTWEWQDMDTDYDIKLLPDLSLEESVVIIHFIPSEEPSP